MKTGIDAISFDVAKIRLPIKTLAQARNIEPEKLEKGLGLLKMTLPDKHQDAVVFGANALTKLVLENDIDLKEISRIYVGTESGIDSSKPIGSFLTTLIEQKFGENILSECDVVDFTFACIGGVDALQNCLDYVRLNPHKKAIVVTSDIAKYDLESTGEYTQGAGALAMLIASNPRIIAFENNWAVNTKGVFDFFKPYRSISKQEITGNETNENWFGNLEAEIEIHKDQPVFDGQYSNQCYMDRTRHAYFQFKKLKNTTETLYNSWKNIIMHLPYSFQGRRMLPEIYSLDSKNISVDSDGSDYQAKLKEVAKTDDYKSFVNEKLQPAEIASSLIGNLYTGSIFMGFLSALSHFDQMNEDISDQTFGFLAYGSGSKSKVFEGTIQPEWKSAISKVKLFQTLEQSFEIDFETYQKLHKKEQQTSVLFPKKEWVLDRIETEIPNLTGARYYKWMD
ncbi:hydroxymethylglutaryl-CoA synthase [Flavobacterium noncentrifugens]|uniref:Hydroxymethylglutaryl-CoA synthase n=1 Tax=Flavobacterium noncentrifugens TaxID=1128970 RepID=A0A1G8SK92_9FLAO|nr:hydroxymethylglutaryl-CoA synthase [Flavobacterium noncentrifugens]GEP49869.1 hydroxymethylglutaryl-CoA synthase [Flavobacterium noncentrifugens]SDJ29672.1 hydroxymethylglutaryl-CoA synthase [Flavobacterium noncentrifugens]